MRIRLYQAEDAELLQIWEVPSHAIVARAEDITHRFAVEWSREFDLGEGDTADEYLRPLPPFVQVAARDHLVREWERAKARRDDEYIPNFSRSAS